MFEKILALVLGAFLASNTWAAEKLEFKPSTGLVFSGEHIKSPADHVICLLSQIERDDFLIFGSETLILCGKKVNEGLQLVLSKGIDYSFNLVSVAAQVSEGSGTLYRFDCRDGSLSENMISASGCDSILFDSFFNKISFQSIYIGSSDKKFKTKIIYFEQSYEILSYSSLGEPTYSSDTAFSLFTLMNNQFEK